MTENLITVFTPTYNRAYTLDNLYHSLIAQTSKNFEWLIVDDGSTDDTKEKIKQFAEENKIRISYHYQENAGKHIAVNTGVKYAKGVLFLIADSDDKLPENCIETVSEKYEIAKNIPNFGGVAGRKAYFNNAYVGSQEDFEPLFTNALDIRYKHNIDGDLAEVFLTDVLKKFPFPQYENEKFCPEALLWNRIAQHYKLYYFSESIYQCEYLPDGLTAAIVKIRMKSPQASMVCYSELASYDIPLKEKIKATINFWRFSFNANAPSFFHKMRKTNFFMSLIGLPVGYMMYVKDKKNFG